MSRLRRLVTEESIFFVTCNLARMRSPFTHTELDCLLEVFRAVRRRRRFLLAGYALMPDHWHALIVPGAGDTLPRLMNALKVAAMRRVNAGRNSREPLWQGRYFDHVIRAVRGFHEKLEYMHLNPVRKGLVEKPGEWRWSSFHSYGGPGTVALEVDRLNLPVAGKTIL